MFAERSRLWHVLSNLEDAAPSWPTGQSRGLSRVLINITTRRQRPNACVRRPWLHGQKGKNILPKCSWNERFSVRGLALDTVDRYIPRYQNNAAGIKTGQSQGATLLSARSKQARNMFQSPEICKSKGRDQRTSCRGAGWRWDEFVLSRPSRKIHLCPRRVACKHSLSKGAGFDARDSRGAN